MPNIKSAKKRVLVSEKKAEINKAFTTTVKTTAKKFDKALEEGNKEAVQLTRKQLRKLIPQFPRAMFIRTPQPEKRAR